MGSLRTRLLIGTVGSMLLLLTVFSLIVYATIRSALWKQFDARLESTAHLFAAAIEQDANEIELGLSTQQLPELWDTDHATYYQLWRDDETVVAKSPLLHSDHLLRIAEALDSPVFADWRGSDGRPLRAIGLRFIPRRSDSDGEGPRQQVNLPALSLTVARDAAELHGQLRFLLWLLLIASGAVTALSLLIAAVVVQHGLAPLNLIAAQIAAMRADDLTTRVDAPHTPTEIAPIKERLNDLLSGIEASFNRERRFTADVAHELRNPLAGLRSAIEVTLVRSRNTEEYQTVLADCLEIVRKMQTMVNNLLMLARLDTQQMTFRREPVQIAELVNSCWRPFSERTAERQITFECSIPDDLTCTSDADGLSMILSNLLDNAAAYTNDGGRISAAAHRTGQRIELTISNTGCSLTNEQISQVFDCFWRGDSSRKDIGLHCGLGLALVQRLVRALGGSVAVQLHPKRIFAVRINIRDDSPDPA
jgi:signal transduction histidine kinase